MLDSGALEAERKRLGREIESARKLKGWTLAQLADRAGYNERTIRNAIQGNATRVGTLHTICSALDVDMKESGLAQAKIADQAHGGYTLESSKFLVGKFIAIRRRFPPDGMLFRSWFEFEWSDEQSCLIFHEHQKYISDSSGRLINYSQTGEVHISSQMGLTHLLTTTNGAIRTITLCKPDLFDDSMYGVVLTQAQLMAHYQPCVSPMYFSKCDPQASIEMLDSMTGPFGESDDSYSLGVSALKTAETAVSCFAHQVSGQQHWAPQALSR